jgi:hypothetical protein
VASAWSLVQDDRTISLSAMAQAPDPRCPTVQATLDKLMGVGGAAPDQQTLPKAREATAAKRLEVSRLEAASPRNEAQLQQARRELTTLTDDENYLARQVNILNERLVEFRCPGADPTLTKLRTEGFPAPPEPPAPKGGTAVTGDWTGQWDHTHGTMTLTRNMDVAGTAPLLDADNEYGPPVTCDPTPEVFWGDITWRGGHYDQQSWSGKVLACTNGDGIHGKYSNRIGMASADFARLGERLGTFVVKLTKVEAAQGTGGGSGFIFVGTYSPRDRRTQMPLQLVWQGTRR